MNVVFHESVKRKIEVGAEPKFEYEQSRHWRTISNVSQLLLENCPTSEATEKKELMSTLTQPELGINTDET